jgi:hypothetical protein
VAGEEQGVGVRRQTACLCHCPWIAGFKDERYPSPNSEKKSDILPALLQENENQ